MRPVNELKEYTAAVSVLQYQRQVVNTIQEYQSKLSYAEQIRETTGQEIWLISDRGYEEIFGKYSRQREFILILALVTAIMIIVSESIAMEIQNRHVSDCTQCAKRQSGGDALEDYRLCCIDHRADGGGLRH